MQVWVLFLEKGQTKITTNAAEAKKHDGKLETGMLKRDYAKNERYCDLPSGKILITPGETKFIPNGKAPAAKAEKSDVAEK